MKGADVHIETEAYCMGPARYARNKVAVRPLDGKNGMKGRTERLACALPGSYSHREHSYIMSRSAALRLHELYQAGWDAHYIAFKGSRPDLIPPSVIKPGMRVEVHQIVAGGADPSQHLWRWCSGYVFVKVEESGNVLVRITKGTFAGQLARFSKNEVRASSK